MIRALLTLIPAWLWALLLAGALATSGAIGWRTAAKSVRGEWAQAELTRERAGADKRREDARISRAASAQFEAWRRSLEQRAGQIQKGLKDGLRQPLQCAATVGDVLVPRDAVGILRDAAADHREPATAASEPGR